MVRLCQLGAVTLLVLAATVMPWATYKDLQSGATTDFRGGRLGLALIALGVAFLVVSLLADARGSAVLRRAEALVGIAAIVVSVADYLSKISAANHAALNADTGSGTQTSFAIGAAIAVLAAVFITVTAFVDAARIPTPVVAKSPTPA